MYACTHLFLRFYLLIPERCRERQRPRQTEKQAPWGEPDVGLDPGTLGSRPGPPGASSHLCFILTFEEHRPEGLQEKCRKLDGARSLGHQAGQAQGWRGPGPVTQATGRGQRQAEVTATSGVLKMHSCLSPTQQLSFAGADFG